MITYCYGQQKIKLVPAVRAGMFKEVLKSLIYTPEDCTIFFILLCQVAWQPCLVNELSRCYLANELLVVIIAISIFNCFCVLTLVCFDIAATGGLDTLSCAKNYCILVNS